MVTTYDLRGLGADFVIHYGGDEKQIDAFTFGNSLIALGNAMQAINSEINPGYSLEVSVVAVGPGSFRPRIRTKPKRLASLLVTDFRAIIVQVLAAVIITRCLGTDQSPKYEITADHVQIHNGDNVIILPREAYESFKKLRENPDVGQPVSKAFEILEEDDEVKNFGFARSPKERRDLPFKIDRENFATIARPREALKEGQREHIVDDAPLQVVRALFEDSTRRWQFVWRGNRISAPILDQDFRRKIIRGEISITHGDVFIAQLRVIQTSDSAGIWVNDSYEIIRIVRHQKAAQQPDLLNP